MKLWALRDWLPGGLGDAPMDSSLPVLRSRPQIHAGLAGYSLPSDLPPCENPAGERSHPPFHPSPPSPLDNPLPGGLFR